MTEQAASNFFAMGGYAAFVWPAYGISLIALVVLLAVSWRWMKRVERIVAASNDHPK